MPFKTPHPLYSVWRGINRRCFNPNFKHYPAYGGRGITVCERWRKSFPAFVQDMGPRPDGFTIERIDVNGDYEPGNCRWASRKEQMLNQRNTRKVTIDGVTYTAAILSEISGLKTDTIMERAKHCDTLDEILDPKKRVFLEGLTYSPNFGKTHCNRGHEYTEENTYRTPAGYRHCRQCQRIRDGMRGPRKKK